MNLNNLKKFAQGARRKLMGEVSSRMEYLLGHDDAYIRANAKHVEGIRRRLKQKAREQVVEEVAYTWFNRIVALRFMDLRGYNKVRIVSPQAGQVQPEILYQIKQGRTPKALHSLQDTFNAYLEGRIASDQPDREIYTAALLGICNDYAEILPFLFRRVDEYMAVLLPTDLLSENSILADVQNAITEEEVEDVEVIGWLYQFYISEKKDQVFARPKGEKIKKEDIPAATQLFTPHWIVRYMVENSLGRLWRNNFPDTRVSEQMDYYIEGDPEPDYLKISGPEEITLLDPACGSGHILTYAFDLLYAMYEEAGYTPSEIPSLILQNNLYGIDIDTRAAELAAFALTMKARDKDRFFFQRGVEPNMIAMEDVQVDPKQIEVGASQQLRRSFELLAQATKLGTLIRVPHSLEGEIEHKAYLTRDAPSRDIFTENARQNVQIGLEQLRYLAARYHCVVTNPPYMGSSNANARLKSFISKEWEQGKADIFGAFILQGIELLKSHGYLGIITQHTWMFISKFTALREYVLRSTSLLSMIHLGPGAFETIGGEVVQSVAFVLNNSEAQGAEATVVSLTDVKGSAAKASRFRDSEKRKRIHQDYMRVLPGSVMAYWLPHHVIELFETSPAIENYPMTAGIMTTDNDQYVRRWHEVSSAVILDTSLKGTNGYRTQPWRFFNKGGGVRRWFGLNEMVVDWREDGRAIKSDVVKKYPYLKGNYSFVIRGEDLFYKGGITWSALSSTRLSARLSIKNAIMATVGPVVLPPVAEQPLVLGLLNSKAAEFVCGAITPTQHYDIGPVGKLPYLSPFEEDKKQVSQRVADLVMIAKADWDARETSWDFRRSPLLTDYSAEAIVNGVDENLTDTSWPSAVGSGWRLSEAYATYRAHWSEQFLHLHHLEEQNNRFFINLYGLQDELSPEVPYSEVTILQDELDKDARERGEIVFNKKEVLRQFVSYGVGCIFGRYSLDEDSLILANAGDTLDTYLKRIPEPRLRPDESGILPITEDDDFPDDLPSQFRAFLRAAFGTEHYDENVQCLEEGLGRDLRTYFLKDFYKDHVKRYKKRPIYWLITSPKGSLRALIYLHRYNRDTVNRFLNDYLRPYQRKLEARRRTAEQSINSGGLSGSERTKARKDIDRISAALEELSGWEREVVRPLAEQRVELDLDDGVKVNYGKLGAILEMVKGLNA